MTDVARYIRVDHDLDRAGAALEMALDAVRLARKSPGNREWVYFCVELAQRQMFEATASLAEAQK